MEDDSTTSSWYTSHLKRIYKEILLTMNDALFYTKGRDISKTLFKEYGTNHEEKDFGVAPMDKTPLLLLVMHHELPKQ